MTQAPPHPHEEFISSRPRLDELPTRRKSGWWDRIKFLLLLVGLFAFFVAAEVADNPILPVSEAINITLDSKLWVLVLAGLELLRQVHYLVSERSSRYHQFWSKRVFRSWNRYMERFNPWNRYRIARATKWLIAIVIGAILLGRIFDTSPFTAYFDALSEAIDAAPAIVQAGIFLLFWIGFQFFLMFYFMTRGGVETFFPDDINTRFSDVWGQDQVKNKITENLLFLDNPEVIEDKGGYVPGGILLWGPPGTGKTLMAEAMAGETGMPFVNVDASMLNIGIGPLKVILLFRKLRKYALKYGGVVVFFDEADALGNRGLLAGMPGQGLPAKTPSPFSNARACGGLGYLSEHARATLFQADTDLDVDEGARRNRFIMGMGGMGGMGGGVLQVLLAQLSGLKKPRGIFNRHVRRALGIKPKPPPRYRLLVVMATNLPEKLDAAMLRPGRIDRIYKVGYPSKPGRIRTYAGYLAKINHTLTDDEIDRLATITPYATGATIKDLVNEALINAIREGRDVVSWKDVVKAKQFKDLGPPEDVEYIERERHATALHEACHAVVAYRVRHHLVIDIATIEKGGNYLGMVSSIPPEDLFTRWRSDYEADVMVSLASLAGEKMFFDGDSSSGVSGDLETATQMSILMEGYWGMGSSIASHGVTHRVGIGGGGQPGTGDQDKERNLLKTTLASRIEEKLAELYARTEQLLATNRVEILAVTHALETHKTLTGEDIEAVIEGKPGPLIDGRTYWKSSFVEHAEAYHSLVVGAHAQHGKVEVALPKLNGRDEWEGQVPVAPSGNGSPRRIAATKTRATGANGGTAGKKSTRAPRERT
ncbi:MAG: AAA family ATPase [Actinobacteria bacterium]|nr:AAA family ATPase [Actinomycetota bacterium]